MRFGKKQNSSYRIVAIDKRKKRNTRYIDNVGFYDPMKEPAIIEINKKKYDSWIVKGAQLSEGLYKLIKSKKVNFKKD
jgi:small subunit ribosomal protein S16